MLTDKDKDFIRRNREQIIEGRTVTVVAWGSSQSGTNPITGEPIVEETPRTEFEVIWKIPNAATGKDDQILVGGVEVEKDDRVITFNDPTIDIDSLNFVEYLGKRYQLIAKSPMGLGRINRFECVGRLVT